MICLARAGEGASETELSQLRLGYALDAGRVHRLAAGVRVIGVPAHRHRVLRGAVAGEPDDMKVERVAESIQTPGDLGFLAVGVVRRRGREEAVLAAVGNERCEGRGRCAAGDNARGDRRWPMPPAAVVPLAANAPAVADASSVSDSPAADVSLVSDSPAPVASLASDSPTADVSPVSDSPVAEGALITEAPPVSGAPPVTAAPPVTTAPPGSEAPPVSAAPPIAEPPAVAEVAPVTDAPPVPAVPARAA